MDVSDRYPVVKLKNGESGNVFDPKQINRIVSKLKVSNFEKDWPNYKSNTVNTPA